MGLFFLEVTTECKQLNKSEVFIMAAKNLEEKNIDASMLGD